MIEDNFTVISCDGELEDAIATLRCRKCETTFEVHMNILKAKNCRHDLGKSLTVVCPNCQAESTTTDKESKLHVLEETSRRLQARIDDHMRDSNLLFKLKQLNWEKFESVFDCLNCGKEFIVNSKAGFNIQQRDDLIVMSCPFCHVEDALDQARTIARLEIVTAVLQLKELTKAIDAIKTGADV